jgi:5-methylcytosine-specific restriction endonuclease McrA
MEKFKDKVTCFSCGKTFKVITNQHLKLCCNLSINEYKKKYPNAKIISEKIKLVRQQNCKNLKNKLKIVKCSRCGSKIETSIVNHWDFICDKCRESKTYPGKIYLPEKDLVVCQICFQAFEQITWMHLKTHSLTTKEYKEKFPKAWLTNKKIKEERKNRFIGNNNPSKRKDVQTKISQSQTFTAKDYIKKYPWIFQKIEKIRDYLGVIEVHCKQCKKWFHPTYCQLYERIRSLTYGSDGQYFYCSDKCRDICPLYRFNPSQFLSNNSDTLYTDSEYQTFRNEVLKRQKEQFGYNFCERCEKTTNLQVHHEKPRKTYPGMILDPDNGIVLCEDCHMNKVHIGECSKANLANIC